MTLRPTKTILMAVLLVSAAVAGHASANAAAPGWNPTVTERLVKLPQNILKKTLDRDFQRSPLADAIADVEQNIQLKLQTLDDLRSATD